MSAIRAPSKKKPVIILVDVTGLHDRLKAIEEVGIHCMTRAPKIVRVMMDG